MSIDLVNTRLVSINEDVKALGNDLKAVRTDVDRINGSIGTVKWILGLGAVGLVGAVLLGGQAVVRDIARDVFREEFAYRATTVQQGRFSAANRIASDPPAFAWKLQVRVDPDKVTMLAAEPLQPLPGVAVSARISDDGASCIMTLHGDPKTLAALPDQVDAKVTIATRQ